MAHEKAGGGDDKQGHAERHEETAADTIEPETDRRLADDAGGAVDALDQADLGLGPAQAMDVQRQEDETAEARHEDEVRERRPGEGAGRDELQPADHEGCGPLSPTGRMAATMTCVAITPVRISVAMTLAKSSTRGE